MEKLTENLVQTICTREGIAAETIEPLSGGLVNQVFRVNDQYVVRIGAREDAFERLRCESELLQQLAGQIPVARVLAFGQQDDRVYQIQEYVRGQKLYLIWDQLAADAQERLVAEFASIRQALASLRFADFGLVYEPARRCATWEAFFGARLQRTLDEISALQIHMAPGYLELAQEYFAEQQQTLAGEVSTLVHGDLWLGNVLVDGSHISALVDFEFALHAPPDYELHILEAFCLYPNDYTEEDPTVARTYTTADFAGFFRLLRKYDPALFETPHLRERVNLYHLQATLSSYLEWRKQQRANIPYHLPSARGFYAARIANFTSNHAVRLF
jgi:aminoglycoside phosphotransferase (APT) family kinase protein